MKYLAYFIIALIVAGCNAEPVVERQKQLALGTFVEITIADGGVSQAHKIKVLSNCFSHINRIENLLSRYNPDSDISRVNDLAWHGPVPIDPLTIDVLKKAVEFYELTDGAFDVTKQAGGSSLIEIDVVENTVLLKKEDLKIDLGAIAKGFAVDEAVMVLKGLRIKNALINAGGDMYCLGKGLKGKGWRIGIQDPHDKKKLLDTMWVKNKAVATSGDYEQGPHIVDPGINAHVVDAPESITIIAPDCTTADALATAVSVLGEERGKELVEELEGVELIIKD